MNSLDYLILIYLAWRIFRGHRRGLPAELQSLFITLIVLAYFFGIFVVFQLSGLIQQTLAIVEPDAELKISLLSLILALTLLFPLRKKLIEHLQHSISPSMNDTGGMITAGLRALLLVAFWMVLLSHFPFGLFDDSIEQSFIGHSLNDIFFQELKRPSE